MFRGWCRNFPTYFNLAREQVSSKDKFRFAEHPPGTEALGPEFGAPATHDGEQLLGVVQLFWRSEDCQRIKRRTRSQRNPDRGSREQKLIAIHLPRMLDGSFEIEIVENVDAHRCQR